MRNQFLTPSRAAFSLTALCVAVGLLASASAIAGDPVYKWKDSGGQSHYSQTTPPAGVKYETITTAGPSTSAAPVAGKPANGSVASGNSAAAKTANSSSPNGSSPAPNGMSTPVPLSEPNK